MCRLLAAVGRAAPVDRLFAAASRMARGAGWNHERGDMVHDAGWGAAWYVADSGWCSHKSVTPIFQDAQACRLVDLLADRHPSALLIHVRNSSFNGLRGHAFLHPQFHETDSGLRWGIMHNGSLSPLRDLLGSEAGMFDTADYVRFAAPLLGQDDPPNRLVEAMEELPRGWTSANAFLYSHRRLLVVNLFPADTPHPRFYTMHQAVADGIRYFASEPCPEVASSWSPLGRRVAVEIALSSSHRVLETTP